MAEAQRHHHTGHRQRLKAEFLARGLEGWPDHKAVSYTHLLPAMVLVFIGAMWLIFAPSSGKEQPPGTDGYNTEMPCLLYTSVRKQLIVEEAWKALSSANMAEYLRYMYKTVRKYYGEAIVVTQEVDDIISSPVVKESIINNSDWTYSQ